MDPGLISVAQSGSVDALYSLIQEDPYILHNIDVSPFIHTALHEASATGKIDLAMELMILKPSFAKKLNQDGFSPLHVAVENHQVELALELVKFDPSLVGIRGRGGMTPLHHVAKKGGAYLLTEFLRACPESIRDANVNGETALHIAVMNRNYEELKVIRGWIQRMRKSDASSTESHVLNKRDRDGNTALHLAASENDNEAVEELLKCMSLSRNIENKSGKTALDLVRDNGSHMNIDTENIIQKAGGKTGGSLFSSETIMSAFLGTPVTFREYCSTEIARYKSRISDGTRNCLLVTTALIITATYTMALQPKEESKQKDASENLIVLLGFNTSAFLWTLALTSILLPIGTGYYQGYSFVTFPLIGSYFLSISLKYDLKQTLQITFLINIYTIGFLIYYLLHFYVRWKRFTQKKIPNPITQLQESFKSVV